MKEIFIALEASRGYNNGRLKGVEMMKNPTHRLVWAASY
jgi:hypothetical protein